MLFMLINVQPRCECLGTQGPSCALEQIKGSDEHSLHYAESTECEEEPHIYFKRLMHMEQAADYLDPSIHRDPYRLQCLLLYFFLFHFGQYLNISHLDAECF